MIRELFDVFARFLKVFGLVRTRSDLFGCVRMRSDACGCIWMRSDAFGHFQKIPNFCQKNCFFGIFARFLKKHANTDVASSFLDIFCSRWTYLELGTTLGAQLGIGYRPGMPSASAIGRFLEAPRRLCRGGGLAISLQILNSKE